MTATVISLAAYRASRQPPIRYAPLSPDPAALAISCLLWWSAVLTVAAEQVAALNRRCE